MAERIVQQPTAAAVQEKFSNLPSAETERSTFDMSHSWKGTHNATNIIPILTMEVLPGDTFSVKTTAFQRLATPIHPLMDTLTTDIHYFFVPNRIIWEQWKNFMGEYWLTDPPSTPQTVPQILINLDYANATGTIFDYMGLPVRDDTFTGLVEVNALPYRAYIQIWNDWYRNQNLYAVQQYETGIEDEDCTEDIKKFPKNRHKRGDYFTRALPWPQKGDPVFLPLGETADVLPTQLGFLLGPGYDINDETVGLGIAAGGDRDSADWVPELDDATPTAGAWESPELYADLSQATAATINDIRTAFQVQKLLERDARGGTRYIEILLSHFNVQSPDYRLQRPEFLGGGSERIIISPVAATVASSEAPQGELAAVGTGLVRAGFTHSFTEHGWLFALMSSRSDLTYQDGLDRMWSRRTRLDYYWPSLSHLGEQVINAKEIYFSGTEDDDDAWGYQERYAEYRYQPSRITGDMRSVSPQSLDAWHLSQEFAGGRPPLSALFVADLPPIDRVVAVPSEPDFISDVWHQISATRVMPVYAVPGLVDHF